MLFYLIKYNQDEMDTLLYDSTLKYLMVNLLVFRQNFSLAFRLACNFREEHICNQQSNLNLN